MLGLSNQALTLTVIYSIVVIISIVFTIIGVSSDKKDKTEKRSAVYLTFINIIFYIIWISLLALIVYDTQCLTSGECNIWSWVRTVIYAILPCLSIIFTLLGISMLAYNSSNDEVGNVVTEKTKDLK